MASEHTIRQFKTPPPKTREEYIKEPVEATTAALATSEAADKFPWEEIHPKLMTVLSLRMPETSKAKIQYILANTMGASSLHRFCVDAIHEKITQRLNELGVPDDRREGKDQG